MDTGLSYVTEFNDAFSLPTREEPVSLSMGQEAWVAMSDYFDVAAEQGELLKIHAQKALADRDKSGAEFLLRLQLIQEELAELADAMLDGDIVGCLDALTDLSYVVDGTYLAMGLGKYKLPALAEVHRSNMSKLGPDGRPILGESGRVAKGPNYSPPDLAGVMEKK